MLSTCMHVLFISSLFSYLKYMVIVIVIRKTYIKMFSLLLIYVLMSNMKLFIFFCRLRDTIVLTMRMFQSRVFFLTIVY